MIKPAPKSAPKSAEYAELSTADRIFAMVDVAPAPKAKPATPVKSAPSTAGILALVTDTPQAAPATPKPATPAPAKVATPAPAPAPAPKAKPRRKAKPAGRVAKSVKGTAVYKGRTYDVLWEGVTKYGKAKFKLAFKSDPSKVFWVDAARVTNYQRKAKPRRQCPGDNRCRRYGWPKGPNCA